jgi:hypothetical protein
MAGCFPSPALPGSGSTGLLHPQNSQPSGSPHKRKTTPKPPRRQAGENPFGHLFAFADANSCVRLYLKMRTVEAIIQPNGEVQLVEPVHVSSPRRALVTILEEAPHAHEAALLSEAALAGDWNRPEEEAAWAHLQPGKSS